MRLERRGQDHADGEVVLPQLAPGSLDGGLRLATLLLPRRLLGLGAERRLGGVVGQLGAASIRSRRRGIRHEVERGRALGMGKQRRLCLE